MGAGKARSNDPYHAMDFDFSIWIISFLAFLYYRFIDQLVYLQHNFVRGYYRDELSQDERSYLNTEEETYIS